MTALSLSAGTAQPARLTRLPVYAALCVALALAMLASLTLGYKLYSLPQVWAALTAPDGSETATVIAGLRLPRALIAPLCGAALGMAGVLVQTLSRNRIASPDTLGLNAGASMAVVVASAVFGVQSLTGLSMAAATGALLTSVLVFGVAAGAGGLSPLKIVLVGVTFASLAHAVVEIILTSNEAQLQQLLFWLSGAFVDRPIALFYNGLPVVAVGAVIALMLAPALDALQADDSTAAGLGVPVIAIRGLAFLAVSLLTGAAVSMAGPVAFVGLVVPHVARRLVGLRHRHQLPAAALAGAVYATIADVAARFVIYPVEAPVGAITAVVGAIALLLLLMRRLA
ncbi:putative siderophore transport system permease protein YfiZ precursor [Devosia equisanguinis]|uniref:Putative siderophore transport system permease protein YfiZ n=1 Tax=Devosia equisanguinis TaxID=2490941 RepID=A0A447IGU4_9HYPH|nr:iron ABC transporter permease [Devosia equisanguinis]VDS06648.1 putative siderophore transport system permease protein YfiZ precursor [Devosia equisanguinis]